MRKNIDPCSGSGHILVYLFDVLVQIYESYGVDTRSAVASIVENNIYGLDIDDRAAQLAYFSVMMKACQYDKRFLRRKVQPHVYAIVESNHVDPNVVDYFCNGDSKLKEAMDTIIDELHDAKEYGSIITVSMQNWEALYSRFDEIENESMLSIYTEAALDLRNLVEVAEAMAQKYEVVVTNPPYMDNGDMSVKLSEFTKSYYADSKTDLCAVFIEKGLRFLKENGLIGIITMHSWMFLSSYEKLRMKLLLVDTINMIHLGAHAFEEIGGEIVQTTTFVLRKSYCEEYQATYCRMVGAKTQDEKRKLFLSGKHRYLDKKKQLRVIDGNPVSYWASEKARQAYSYKNLDSMAKPRHGLATSDNDRFLRLWFEVDFEKTSTTKRCDYNKKWFPMSKGGSYRKWYGNLEWLINYEDDGKELKEYAISIYKCSSRTIQNTQFYFKEGLTWSALASRGFSVRWQERGALFGSGGYCAFTDDNIQKYILALLNSKVTGALIQFVSPTLNYEVGHIKTIPVVIDSEKHVIVDELVTHNISISRHDWDSFETSWDFQKHPLLRKVSTIAEAFNLWRDECDSRFNQLKVNEEELNRIFLGIYGLQDELTPKVEDEEVTVRKADLQRDIKSFISYAVGCMFGRYSLDVGGITFAGGEWDPSKYKIFPADNDDILPICDDEYFDDDIVGLFVKFVKTVYGEDTLEENLQSQVQICV